MSWNSEPCDTCRQPYGAHYQVTADTYANLSSNKGGHGFHAWYRICPAFMPKVVTVMQDAWRYPPASPEGALAE